MHNSSLAYLDFKPVGPNSQLLPKICFASFPKDPSWHSGVEPIIQMSGFGDLVLKWPHNNANWNPTCDLYDVLPSEALPSEVHDHGSPGKKTLKGG